jgi:CheY-like chemotaxis protein
VRVDAGQIELVLLNLSVNAQDAMPEGGVLTIEAREVELDAAYAASHAEIAPGPYIMLAISDTGCGMDEQLQAHIFEPFFTTKETGKGTGLGLSTVYGIIKQHGGSIFVYSERNHGSVFKVFFPRVEGDEYSVESSRSGVSEVQQGLETILVAEDSEVVRLLACDLLESFGYRVLAAESPERCIAMARNFAGTIDLLVTDVIMPGMNGKELYQALREVRPALKVLFMSGYTSNVIGQHGVLDQEEAFVQKPFTIQSLSEKVRQVLDG